MDWDDAYANSPYIPDADAIAAEWPRAASAFRASARGEYDTAYGPRPRERYDLFLPAGAPKGLFVFIHGGYWMAFGKSDWSHLAGGAVTRGWAALLPGYDLCPDVHISSITRQIAAALAHAAARVTGPLVVCGHSAGGHLAMRMACATAPLAEPVRTRIVHVLGISGLYDLRPLRRTSMNATLRLDEAEAQSESPALLAPAPGIRITLWVGAEERPEFRRQSALLARRWGRLGAPVRHVRAAGRHHFDVIAPLADPDSGLMNVALDDPFPAPPQGPHPA